MTILMGVFANFPLALATGLGLNAFVAFSIASQMTWADAMGVIVLEGLVILVLVLTGFREAVFNAVPAQLKVAISVGIGLFIALIGLVDRVTGRMRKAHRVGRTVVLRLRFGDFSRATRSHTMPEATAHTATILRACRELLAIATPLIRAEGLTLIGISVANLADDDAVQLALPFDDQSTNALDTVLDDIRLRFGAGVLSRAVHLGRDQGMEMPMLPD